MLAIFLTWSIFPFLIIFLFAFSAFLIIVAYPLPIVWFLEAVFWLCFFIDSVTSFSVVDFHWGKKLLLLDFLLCFRFQSFVQLFEDQLSRLFLSALWGRWWTIYYFDPFSTLQKAILCFLCWSISHYSASFQVIELKLCFSFLWVFLLLFLHFFTLLPS